MISWITLIRRSCTSSLQSTSKHKARLTLQPESNPPPQSVPSTWTGQSWERQTRQKVTRQGPQSLGVSLDASTVAPLSPAQHNPSIRIKDYQNTGNKYIPFVSLLQAHQREIIWLSLYKKALTKHWRWIKQSFFKFHYYQSTYQLYFMKNCNQRLNKWPNNTLPILIYRLASGSQMCWWVNQPVMGQQRMISIKTDEREKVYTRLTKMDEFFWFDFEKGKG